MDHRALISTDSYLFHSKPLIMSIVLPPKGKSSNEKTFPIAVPCDGNFDALSSVIQRQNSFLTKPLREVHTQYIQLCSAVNSMGLTQARTVFRYSDHLRNHFPDLYYAVQCLNFIKKMRPDQNSALRSYPHYYPPLMQTALLFGVNGPDGNVQTISNNRKLAQNYDRLFTYANVNRIPALFGTKVSYFIEDFSPSNVHWAPGLGFEDGYPADIPIIRYVCLKPEFRKNIPFDLARALVDLSRDKSPDRFFSPKTVLMQILVNSNMELEEVFERLGHVGSDTFQVKLTTWLDKIAIDDNAFTHDVTLQTPIVLHHGNTLNDVVMNEIEATCEYLASLDTPSVENRHHLKAMIMPLDYFVVPTDPRQHSPAHLSNHLIHLIRTNPSSIDALLLRATDEYNKAGYVNNKLPLYTFSSTPQTDKSYDRIRFYVVFKLPLA